MRHGFDMAHGRSFRHAAGTMDSHTMLDDVARRAIPRSARGRAGPGGQRRGATHRFEDRVHTVVVHSTHRKTMAI